MTRFFKWLYGPAHNARLWAVSAFEVFRAFVTGGGVLVLSSAIAWAMAHLDELQLSPYETAKVSRWLGVAGFFVHLAIQLFQGRPAPPPAPPQPPAA